MLAKKINKWGIAILAIVAALLIPGAATQAGAFSVDVKNFFYSDHTASPGPRVVNNYDFSSGMINNYVIMIPDTFVIKPQSETAPYALSPYPDPNNAIAVALTTGAPANAKATLSTASKGGITLDTRPTQMAPTPPPVLTATNQWVMEVKLTNFTGMDNQTTAYLTQIGMASNISGPHPEFTASWVGGNLELQAQIYDNTTGSESVVWPTAPIVYKEVNAGLNPVGTLLTLRIVCNVAGREGKVDFEYNLNNTIWVGLATYDIPSGSAFMSFPAHFPYIELRVGAPQQQQQQDPFQVSSQHWNDAQGDVYKAWPRVMDPGQAAYSGVTLNSPGYLDETPLTYNNSAGYWSLSGTLFSDDFNNNTLDTGKWTTTGNSVTETGGTLNVDCAATDNGGLAMSRTIPINPFAPIVVQRKAKVHYAGEYFNGVFGLYFGDSTTFLPITESKHTLFVSHANYNYSTATEQPAHGFYLGQYAAHFKNPTALTDAIWDRWFDEKIVYDPVSGLAELYLDGALKATINVGALPAGARYLKIAIQAWGWYTGHYNYSDDLTVSQPWTGGNVFLSANTPPAPGAVTFNFTATTKAGATEPTVSKTITNYVQPFATNLSPAGNISGTPTFSWNGVTGVTDPTYYAVQVYDATGNRIWNRYNIPSSTTSAVYNSDGKGPALMSGQTYRYNIVTSVVTGGINNDSFANGSFTYTGVGNATTISFSGWVKTVPGWPSADGMQPAAGAQVSAYSLPPQSTLLGTASVDATTGAFTLAGIPKSSDFYLVAQPSQQGYLPALSKLMNWNDNIQALLPFVLFTPAQYADPNILGNTQGNGIIIGRVALQSSPTTFLPGATVTAREWIPPVYPATQITLGVTYPVTYTGGGTATGADGIYMVKNIPPGKLVQLVASLGGNTFAFNGAVVPAQPFPVSEESFFAIPVSGGGTISFSGNLGKYSDNTPISGAAVELVGNASIKTTTATNGSFSLPGLLPGAEFSVKFTGDTATYVPSYSSVMQSTNPIVSQRGFNLFTPAELSAWGIAGGRGLIRGRVINGANQQDGYISGAVVNYTSSSGYTYIVKYEDFQGNLVDGATTANGKYYILNVVAGDIVNVSATQANYTFSQSRKFIARDGAVCQGIITGNPIPGRIAIGGFVMNTATTPVGIGSATVEQIGSAPINSTVSNSDGSYYLTVPAGTNLFLKFSKPQAGTLVPTYTPEMKFSGTFANIGEFNLFAASTLTGWGVTSGKGIIRSRVRDSAGISLGGAVVTAQSQQGRTYTVCYDDACSGLTSTGGDGRYVIKNAEPGDTVTVTAQKAGWSFNQRIFHVFADSMHQGGITGATADEGMIRSRLNGLLAEFNKGASANIETILSFFSADYLNDGETRDALRANMLEGLNRVPFLPQPTPLNVSVTIATGGATARMTVDWGGGNAETFTLTNVAGVWMITGNQKKYRVEAWSGTFQQPTGGKGYWVDMMVRDPLQVISSVSVLGPKTGNTAETFSLIWNAGEKAWRSWTAEQQSIAQFGSTKPTLPLNYTFIIIETGKPTTTISATVNNFVESFATPISPAPGSTVTGIPTFNWLGVGGGYTYGVEVGSPTGANQWGRYNLTGTTYVYDGPALAAGSYYYHVQVRDAAGNFSMVGVPFTYSGEILKGDIDGNGVVNLADAILAVKVIGGQTPDGIRENYGASGTDVNGDGQVGLHEGLYILQRIVGLRDALNVWHSRTPVPSGSSTFFEALAGPNGFLIGGIGTIQKSLDGATWYNSDIGSNSDNFLGLTGNVDGSLFAAGSFGLILKSTDNATTWTVSKTKSVIGFTGIAAGNGKIVAAGSSSSTNKAVISTSADGGSTWSEPTLAVANTSYEGITFGNGKFVVVGYDYGGSAYTAVILTSTDGVTWTAANVTAQTALRGVTWGGAQFVAVGTSGVILTSPDGSNWAAQNSGITDTNKHLNHVGYGNGVYAIAGTDGTILTSADGSAWTSRPSGTTKHLEGVAFGKNTFLVVGGAGTPIVLQSDPL
jgi:hypothetical protein